MESIDRYKNFEVWKEADKLALEIYRATKQFPKEELYGLTSQLRRAALSIPTNIVEGYARKGDKELSHFLDISFASLSETKYLLYFSKNLDYITVDKYESLEKLSSEVGAKLWKFIEVVRHNK
ncbi:MAG: four helix bundle protein [Elusimicrobia bacterium RIFOXYA12_FULL_51_18]|nr:MAG: four helix bundle protein [Elusimicrobia bacterium RIFOXYA12_FULL_51_18]OGS28476.1 MAG: four helix bundle protein [Elusimicrobia bacterium RIFOXYA2_FULL_53_38]